MFHLGCHINFFGILGHFCYLKNEKDQTATLCSMEAESHSLLSRLSRAWNALYEYLVSFWEASMLGHGAGIWGLYGPRPQDGPHWQFQSGDGAASSIGLPLIQIIIVSRTQHYQRILVKGCIAILLPLPAANGFVWTWFHRYTWFLGPMWVRPTKRHLGRFSAVFLGLVRVPKSPTCHPSWPRMDSSDLIHGSLGPLEWTP